MPDTETEDYKKKFLIEQERLAKLYDAYRIQEKALKEANEEIEKLKEELDLKEKDVLSLNELLEKRDKERREMEKEITRLEKITAEYKPKLEKCQEALQKEKDKLAKLYDVAQELDEELRIKTKALEERDKWFMENIKVFEGMCETIKKRKEIAEARALKEDVMKELAGEPTDIEKEAAIEELTTLESVDKEVAEHLYDAGFRTIEELKKARSYQLVAVEGISPTKANDILKEIKKL